MRRFDAHLRRFEEKQEASKPSAFDLLTKLFLPALSLAALIIGQLQQQRSSVLWGLLVFASLSLAIGFYAPIKAKVQKLIWTWRDERTASRCFPEFRKFVRQFGEFVDTGRADTLHYVALTELCGHDMSKFDRLRIPASDLFNKFSYHFRTRVERKAPSLRALQQAVPEFRNLVGSYTINCVLPIFERLPQDLQALLTPQVKSSLNSFQQRYALFLQNLEEFLKDLDQSLLTFQFQAYYFPRPKPL